MTDTAVYIDFCFLVGVLKCNLCTKSTLFMCASLPTASAPSPLSSWIPAVWKLRRVLEGHLLSLFFIFAVSAPFCSHVRPREQRRGELQRVCRCVEVHHGLAEHLPNLRQGQLRLHRQEWAQTGSDWIWWAAKYGKRFFFTFPCGGGAP